MKRNPFPTHVVRSYFFHFVFLFLLIGPVCLWGQYVQDFSGISGDYFQVINYEAMPTPPKIHCGTNLNPPSNCPSYNIFWIFSDGHYFKIEEGTGPPSKTIYYPGFQTGLGKGEEVAVYFTEKYTNDKPPAMDDGKGNDISINTSLTSITPTFETTQYTPLIYNGRLGIDYNHITRKGYETVFVLSYKPVPETNGHVYFFYNAEKDLGNGKLTSRPGGVFQYAYGFPQAKPPKHGSYFPFKQVPNDLGTQRASAFDGISGTSFNSSYGDLISFSYDSNDLVRRGKQPAGTSKPKKAQSQFSEDMERRAFHVLDAPGGMVGEHFNFMLVLTTDDDTNAINLNDYPPDMKNKINGLFPQTNTGGKTIGTIGNEYVLEVIDTTMKLRGDHDPNKMCLINYCDHCANPDMEAENCQARYFLEICNDGSAPASDISIVFHDELKNVPGASGYHSGFKHLKIEKITTMWNGASFPVNKRCYRELDGALYKPNLILPSAYNNDTQKYIGQQCARIEFTVNATSKACGQLTDLVCCSSIPKKSQCPVEEPANCICSIKADIKFSEKAMTYSVCNSICPGVSQFDQPLDDSCGQGCNWCKKPCTDIWVCFKQDWGHLPLLKKAIWMGTAFLFGALILVAIRRLKKNG